MAFFVSLLAVVSLQAHAIFGPAPGLNRRPTVVAAVILPAETIAVVEPQFLTTLLQMSQDREMVRWVLAGGSDALRFPFIYTVLKKITERKGLKGEIEYRVLNNYLEETVDYAHTTRSALLARMGTMKLIRNFDGRVSVDPALIFRVGILSGAIPIPGQADTWMKARRSEERRLAKSKESSLELFKLRLAMFVYSQILSETAQSERSAFGRVEILRRISETNPFGLAVLNNQIAGLIRSGALSQGNEPVDFDRKWGVDSTLAVLASPGMLRRCAAAHRK